MFVPRVLCPILLSFFVLNSMKSEEVVSVQPKHLVVHYRLDDGTGIVATDDSGNGFDGTLVGMDEAAWVDGKFGKALSFAGQTDGKGDDRLKIPLAADMSFHGYSVSLWFKTRFSHTQAGMLYFGSPDAANGFGTQNEYHINFTANAVLSYNIMDASYNEAPTVTRTVIVEENTPVTDPLEDWINTHLSGFTTEQQNPEADPDHDGLQNLLEYALGSSPAHPNSSASLPKVESSFGHLSITFFRLKSTVDNQITYTPQLSTSLSNPTWDSSALTVELAAKQDDLPSEDFERVTATAKTPIAEETKGQQFIRVTVTR
jgi:hypothetical protein